MTKCQDEVNEIHEEVNESQKENDRMPRQAKRM